MNGYRGHLMHIVKMLKSCNYYLMASGQRNKCVELSKGAAPFLLLNSGWLCSFICVSKCDSKRNGRKERGREGGRGRGKEREWDREGNEWRGGKEGRMGSLAFEKGKEGHLLDTR